MAKRSKTPKTVEAPLGFVVAEFMYRAMRDADGMARDEFPPVVRGQLTRQQTWIIDEVVRRISEVTTKSPKAKRKTKR